MANKWLINSTYGSRLPCVFVGLLNMPVVILNLFSSMYSLQSEVHEKWTTCLQNCSTYMAPLSIPYKIFMIYMLILSLRLLHIIFFHTPLFLNIQPIFDRQPDKFLQCNICCSLIYWGVGKSPDPETLNWLLLKR